MAGGKFILRENEQVFAQKVKADSWEQPGRLRLQYGGKAYFTDQRVVFLAKGLIGAKSVSFELAMSEIASVESGPSPLHLPFGITITLKNGDKYVLAVTDRDKYIQWIQGHIG